MRHLNQINGCPASIVQFHATYLGLVAPDQPVRMANPIYREVIVRVLALAAEYNVTADPRSWGARQSRAHPAICTMRHPGIFALPCLETETVDTAQASARRGEGRQAASEAPSCARAQPDAHKRAETPRACRARSSRL